MRVCIGSSSSGTVPATDGVFQARYAGGVFFRGDVGSSGWQRADAGVPGGVQAIAVDLSDADLVLVSTESGLFRSQDGGASWIALDLGAGQQTVTALAADPQGPTPAPPAVDSSTPRRRATPGLVLAAAFKTTASSHRSTGSCRAGEAWFMLRQAPVPR
jgi:hypothetical protein